MACANSILTISFSQNFCNIIFIMHTSWEFFCANDICFLFLVSHAHTLSLSCLIHPDFSIFNDKSFQAIDAEGMDMEIDLSNLGTVNTMFAALFR